MKRLLARVSALGGAVLLLIAVAMPGAAVPPVPHSLTVDGTVYAPTKVVGNGPTVHYETPDVNPVSAFSERHVWVGNGSENLPCPNGIHWIDNANVLTISNCLEVPEETTTTTQPEETTTTTQPEETTTTTQPEETTTTTVVDSTTTTSIPVDIPSGLGEFQEPSWLTLERVIVALFGLALLLLAAYLKATTEE